VSRLRRVHRTWRRVKPWVQRVLDVLDVFDWKTWVWYSLLGMESLTTTILQWGKRRTRCPGQIVRRGGKFYIVGERRR
jgi:hypothetical protein